jgi:hypothetical protein
LVGHGNISADGHDLHLKHTSRRVHAEKQPFFVDFWKSEKILFQMLDRIFRGL